MVYHPADLVKHIAYYTAGDTYKANVPVFLIKGTTHLSYYGKNWLVMMMNLDWHKEDTDFEAVIKAISDTQCFEPRFRGRIRGDRTFDTQYIDRRSCSSLQGIV